MTTSNLEDDETEIIERDGMDLVPVDSEVSTQIATAKRYPRNVPAVRKRATELATLDEETAASCFYSLPRAGKPIVGPSVRLAEIVASSWGNIRYGARVLDHDEQQIRAQGMCWDLESNTAVTIEVARRITDRNGRTYNDDMIAVTGNAANSIALRNAVLKVIPTVVWKTVYEQARKVAIGDALTLTVRRQGAIDYFAKLGVDQARVLARVGRTTIEEITLEDLEVLVGLKTSIRDGDTTLALAFAPPVAAAPEPPSKSKKDKAAAPAQPAQTPPADEATDPLMAMETAPKPQEQPQSPPLKLVRQEEEPKIEPAQMDQIVELAKRVNSKAGKKTAALAIVEEISGTRNAAQLSKAQAGLVIEALTQAAGNGEAR